MSAQLEEERKQYEEQLEIVLVSLKDDPDNAELLSLKNELDQMIKLIDDSLADIRPESEPAKAPAKVSPAAPPPAEEKWSRENHPAFRKASTPAPAPAPAAAPEDKESEAALVAYQVNDNVMAKWVSGDKGFYPARITSVTGSSTNPIYTVKFKSYDTIETLRSRDIRPVAAQKRKADASAVPSTSATPVAFSPTTAAGATPGHSPSAAAAATTTGSGSGSGSGIVLSAAASLYPQAQQQQAGKDGAADQEADGEKPRKKFKKIKATKELEAGKNKWQEFSAKGKFGKGHKKDSMFRTPDGVHGRVGFTGSGQAMRKDPTRSRHIYQPNEDLD